MPDTIEWAHVDSLRSGTLITAAHAYQNDPDDRALSIENSSWNTCLFLDGVAIYADSVEEMYRWLSDKATQAKNYLTAAERLQGASYLVSSVIGGSLSHKSFADASDALWSYLEATQDDECTHATLLAVQQDESEEIDSFTR